MRSGDQALAMRVLRMANSAVYARGKIINNLPTAVQRIGITEIRNVALTLGVVHQYQGRLSQFVDPWLFWEHSIACGLLAHAIGKQCSGASRDNLFLWGVLHDLGRLILLDHAAEAYTRVLETAESIERPIEVIERKMLLVDHCEILARAAGTLGIPLTVRGTRCQPSWFTGPARTPWPGPCSRCRHCRPGGSPGARDDAGKQQQ